jgi:hypothetical protein
VRGALRDPAESQPARPAHSDVAHRDEIRPDVPGNACQRFAGLAGAYLRLSRDSVALGRIAGLREYSQRIDPRDPAGPARTRNHKVGPDRFCKPNRLLLRAVRGCRPIGTDNYRPVSLARSAGHKRAGHLLRMHITNELIAPRSECWDRVFNDAWSGEDFACEQRLAVAAVDRHVVGN